MSLAAVQTQADVSAGELLDRLDTGIVQLDAAGWVLRVNSEAEQAFGLGRERLLGRLLAESAPLPPELEAALQLPAHRESGLRFHELRLAGGSYDCTLVDLPAGGTLLELHNLHWEQLRSQLQQREVQTGLLELLGRNLGHEIRNPLGGIRGAAQMLAAELELPELADLARLIMREADRIDELLRNLGQRELARRTVHIYRLLDEALGLLQSEFGREVQVTRDFDPSIPALQGDFTALRQVLLNLLRNAYEAGARNIRLRTRVEFGGSLLGNGQGAILRIDVIDDGEGVPERLRKLLFLPLVTGKRDGTGLGLALSQQIAAAHGGLLSYEPLGDGQGSRFSLLLPLSELSRPDAAAGETE